MNVNMRFTHWLAAAAILLAPIAGVRAQTGAAPAGSPAATAPAKIAVINVRNAIVLTAEGKTDQAQMQSQFAPKESELANTQKQIQDIQRRLSDGARTLSDDEKAKLQRQGELLTRQLQRNQDDYNDIVNAAQAEILDEIGRKMSEVLDRYARENGYSVVLDSSAQNGPLVYSSSQIDITQDIVRLYDQQYPVKTAAATPPKAPAPPKKQQ